MAPAPRERPGACPNLEERSEMAKGTCSVEGCEKRAKGRGWCAMHYERWRQHGDVMADLKPLHSGPNDATKFWAYVKPDGACLMWTGLTSEHGYGLLHWNGRQERAHRVAFYLRLERWPEGPLRHLCNRPGCVLHAVEGTMSENRYDSVAAGTHNNARKTHCKWGHEFTPENTYRDRNGNRGCRTCRNERNARQSQAMRRSVS